MKTNILFARVYFLFALMIYMAGGAYIDSLTLPPHYDPILELIPIVNMSATATYGLIFLYAAALIYLKPLLGSKKEAEFWIIIASTLILRVALCLVAGFGPPAEYFLIPDKNIDVYFLLKKLYLLFERDCFFSGHTAIPFMFFLFFEDKIAKIIFLTGTIVMAVSVLLLHHHYVIDVLAAPIIVWAVYSFFKFLIFDKKEGAK